MHSRLAAYLRRLQWTILRPLASRLGGDERSLLLGPGMEIDELREYQPGDDVRQIDWNMMARLGRPYVRQSQVTRALDVWMLVDVSASLEWGTAQCLKSERATDFLAVTAQIFLQHHHHVGALLFANRPLVTVPPSAGSQHLLRLLQAINGSPAINGRATAIHDRSLAVRDRSPSVYGQGTDLKAALERAERILPRRSFVILLSDFLVPDGWQAVLRRLAQRHEMVAVSLRDPRESELPDVGVITLEDPETGRQLMVDTASSGLRERFHQAALEQAARLRADLTAAGIDALELSTASDMLPALVSFLEKRRRLAHLRFRGHGR
jgi:uncharacterized protein (DUF58 family)